jgi:tRNA/rRNA methyltransferase
MSTVLERITIVLDRPQHPGNVGSVARAMKNMGLNQLRLVSPCDYHEDIAGWMAVSAKEILDQAKVYDHLREAISDCSLVIGTVPPDRPRFHSETYSPREMALRIHSGHPEDYVAIVFGREDNGLSNQELDLCHEFVSIPSGRSFPSLNIAQAVMVIAYEVFVAVQQEGPLADRASAGVDAVEQMYGHLEETLLAIGFLDAENPAHIMRDLRRIFSRARLDAREVKIVRGILRQIDWAMRNRMG